MKALPFMIVLALSGCTNPMTLDHYRGVNGERTKLDVWQQPLCFLICVNTLGTSGSNVEGSGSGASTLSQTTQAGGSVAVAQ